MEEGHIGFRDFFGARNPWVPRPTPKNLSSWRDLATQGSKIIFFELFSPLFQAFQPDFWSLDTLLPQKGRATQVVDHQHHSHGKAGRGLADNTYALAKPERKNLRSNLFFLPTTGVARPPMRRWPTEKNNGKSTVPHPTRSSIKSGGYRASHRPWIPIGKLRTSSRVRRVTPQKPL